MAWHDIQNLSSKRLRQLFGLEDYGIDIGEYGFGTVRTVAQYEKYAGIDFKNQTISDAALAGEDPILI